MQSFLNDNNSKHMRGSVRISEDKLSPEITQEFSLEFGEIIRVMHSGEGIGENSFLSGTSRTATCITYTDCDMIVLDKRDFNQIISNFEELTRAKRLLVSDAYSFPSNFSTNVIDNFMYSFSVKSMSKNQFLTEEGKEGNNIYLIYEGEVIISKDNIVLCVIGWDVVN